MMIEGTFEVAWPDNRARVVESNCYGYRSGDSINDAVVQAVEDTVENGTLWFGYSVGDDMAPPVVQFIDADSYCRKTVPLMDYLDAEVEHYERDLNPEIDGDPVYYRFARYMQAAVRDFIDKEAALAPAQGEG